MPPDFSVGVIRSTFDLFVHHKGTGLAIAQPAGSVNRNALKSWQFL
jgi:hypothetical protein